MPRNGWGGARPGAGRPLGSKNKPILLDLPATDDPLKFLMLVVNCQEAPVRLRVAAAKAALPICYEQKV
jgi:hypothetical protein